MVTIGGLYHGPESLGNGVEEDAYTLMTKGSKLLQDGHPHQAAVLLEKASHLEPTKTSIREALARALFNSGQLERAFGEFTQLVERDPANDYAHFGLGLCHAKMGDEIPARAHLKIAIAMRPDSEAYRKALAAVSVDG